MQCPLHRAAQFRQQVKDAGRDPDSVGIEATIFAPHLDPEGWAKQIAGWMECGATQIVFRPQAAFPQTQEMVNAFAEVMQDFS